MATWAIPLAALIVSVTTLIFSVISLRHKADGDYVRQIEERVRQLERDLSECTRARETLQRENVELLRQLVSAGKSR